MRGEVTLPGDKSIAHRAIILSSLANAKTIVRNFPLNEDSLATIAAFRKLGIKIALNKASYCAVVHGKKLYGLRKPGSGVYIKESGTTFRLLLGVLAGQPFKAKLCAGPSLSRRPMLRVIEPLRLMGAKISARSQNYPPVTIAGNDLKGITYKLPVASAQVKSAILLAGLFANGSTRVIEPVKARDHTERMLKLFKADLKIKGSSVIVKGQKELVSPGPIYIPSDISSAAFFMVAASIIPDSKVLIKNVSLNPGRLGVINALKRMGAKLTVKKSKLNYKGNEPMGDIEIKSSVLAAIRIRKNDIPSLIDELPVLMVAASLAKGTSVFEGVSELRVKETDRIKSMLTNLTKMDANIKVVRSRGQENIIIKGVNELHGAKVKSFGDHRTAMSMLVAGLAAFGETSIDDISCINKSFPNFLETINKLI